MKRTIIRVWCYLWGCDNGDCGCKRCGADYYGDWIERAYLYRTQRFWWWLKYTRVEWPKCRECGKKMKWSERHNHYCSDDCLNESIPF